MNRFCFLYVDETRLIDICKVESERFEFLISISKKVKNNFSNNMMVKNLIFDKITLVNSIDQLLQNKPDYQIDFGNRFDEKDIFVQKEYKNRNLKLYTSGYDNLLNFALNIWENIDNSFKIIISDKKTFNLRNL